MRDDKHKLQNTPYVDLSYKWAGGGFLSDVTDLLKFGDIMMYSYQNKNETLIDSEKPGSSDKKMDMDGTKPGFLKPETMRLIWEPVVKTECSWDKDGSYAMGWSVVSEKCDKALCRHQRFYVTHTGGAVGCSSALVILPHIPGELAKGDKPPKGVTVAVIANLTSVGLNKTALQIAKLFDKVDR